MMQSTEVIHLFLNFAALHFVSEIDNIGLLFYGKIWVHSYLMRCYNPNRQQAAGGSSSNKNIRNNYGNLKQASYNHRLSWSSDINDLQTMQLGENGMPEYTNSGIRSNVLAISQMVHAGDPSSLANEILFAKDMLVQDLVDLVILVFVTQNTHGGKGEKDLSFKIFLQVWKKFAETSPELLGLFSQFGYWKDLLLLMKMAVEDACYHQGTQQSCLQAHEFSAQDGYGGTC